MNIEWRPVVGHEHLYEVSQAGAIRNRITGKERVIHVNKSSGYLSIGLWKNTKRTESMIHRIVTAAFLGPCPDGYEVNHKDRNKLNPNLENLEYVTRSENVLHAYANGVVPRRGELGTMARLTETQALKIRASTISNYVLSREYKVTPQHIGDIKRGQKWKHLANSSEGKP